MTTHIVPRAPGAWFLATAFVLVFAASAVVPLAHTEEIPDKTVVLTFDDAVKSHITLVAPLLEELGFGATFFITQAWMDDKANFLTWEDVAALHRKGFEIGNHSWTHSDFSTVKGAAALGEELEKVEEALTRVGVPKPISFAWCGNLFGPESVEQLRRHGYKLARRGMGPELPYGATELGLPLDVAKHHPLLIPTTGDAYPYWTFENFKNVVATARAGKIAVLQFHGAPDVAHPWVNTPPDNLRRYMLYLKESGYRVIPLRDVLALYDQSHLPDDPMVKARLSQTDMTDQMRALLQSSQALSNK